MLLNKKKSENKKLHILSCRSIYKMVGVSDETKAEERVEAIFSKMDDNKDGKLSVIEFVEGTKDDPAIRQLLQVGELNLMIMHILETFKSKLENT